MAITTTSFSDLTQSWQSQIAEWSGYDGSTELHPINSERVYNSPVDYNLLQLFSSIQMNFHAIQLFNT